jgi:hypothetical protein
MASGHYDMWLLENGLTLEKLQGPNNALDAFDGWGQVCQTALPQEFYPSPYVTIRTIEYLEQATLPSIRGRSIASYSTSSATPPR